jgi:hypothetical protein
MSLWQLAEEEFSALGHRQQHQHAKADLPQAVFRAHSAIFSQPAGF